MTCRRAWTVALLAATLATAGCTQKTATSEPALRAVTVSGMTTLHGPELLYGASAVRTSSFVYQPDVIFIGGGARAIVAASADGMTWTFRGNAPGVDEIQTGKVVLATSFAAGRVLATKRVGNDLQVVIGPAALTEIIRDGEIRSSQPIALVGYQAYSTPDQPGLETDTPSDAAPSDGTAAGGTGDLSGSATTTTADPASGDPTTTETSGGSAAGPTHERLAATVAHGALGANPLPPPASSIPEMDVANWHVQPSCCSDANLHVGYDHNGARVQGTAALGFTKPTVDFSLKIGGAKVLSASARLSGAAHLGFNIFAAVQSSAADFHGGRIQVPVDLDIPVPVGGLPMTIGIHQLFSVSLGLSGAASLSTTGDYALDGALGFSVTGSSASLEKPRLPTTKSALDNILSVAVAPQALGFAYGVKLSIGVGPPGFNAGIWYQVNAALDLADSGSQEDPLQGTSLVACKTVALAVAGKYGVGYSVPSLVASAVNLFLRAFTNSPRHFEASGGPSWGPDEIFNQHTPPCSK